jgi:hypothetical protein
MRVRYIGDPSDQFAGPLGIEEGGMTFLKGQWATVDDDHARAEKFRNNPTFEVKGDDRPALAAPKPDPEAELTELREALDARGLSYTEREKAPALRSRLLKATPTGEASAEDDGAPVPAAYGIGPLAFSWRPDPGWPPPPASRF